MLTIRPALASDQEGISACGVVGYTTSKHSVLIRKWIEKEECTVAEIDGQIAGYAVLNYEFFGDGFLAMRMVKPEFQRQGIGRQLLRHQEKICVTEKLWASTNLSNHIMQKFLKSENFILSGYVDNLDEGDPELIFVKMKADNKKFLAP